VIDLITGHEIRKVGKQEVLNLYLSYDVEFSLDFYKRKSGKSMKELIRDYIKNNRILWNGNRIVLFFGGIAIGTVLLFSNPIREEGINYTFVNPTIIDAATEKVSITENDDFSDTNAFIEEIRKEDDSSDRFLDDKSGSSINQSSILESESTKNQERNSVSVSLNQKTQNNDLIENKNNLSSVQDEKTETSLPQDFNSLEQTVTIHRRNGTSLTLSMTDYLIGVVAAEMPASFPMEALKAQAVVARTYALKKIASGGKLTDDVSTQVYRDSSYLRSIWKDDYDFYYHKIKSAVQSTDKMTVKYQGSYIEAIYHSTSNGKTEDAVHVWGNDVPYLKSVDSTWDQSATTYLKTEEQDLSTVFEILGIVFQEPISIEVLSRNASGRISNIRVGTWNYTGVEFRNLLGLRSSDFDLDIRDGKLIVTTRGYGHGVGMSQYGAKGMAEAGYSYQQILSHYYPGTTLSKE